MVSLYSHYDRGGAINGNFKARSNQGDPSKLPDTANIDDIMYELYVIDKVKKGREAAERGDTISIEDLKKEMQTW